MREIHAAVGILMDSSGRVLLSQRTAGKTHAGDWEFPGGKLELAEVPLHGLVRELREELGIEVRVARHLTRYSHASDGLHVHLYVWQVLEWGGRIRAAEDQPLRWVPPGEALATGLLAADEPIIEILKASRPDRLQ